MGTTVKDVVRKHRDLFYEPQGTQHYLPEIGIFYTDMDGAYGLKNDTLLSTPIPFQLNERDDTIFILCRDNLIDSRNNYVWNTENQMSFFPLTNEKRSEDKLYDFQPSFQAMIEKWDTCEMRKWANTYQWSRTADILWRPEQIYDCYLTRIILKDNQIHADTISFTDPTEAGELNYEILKYQSMDKMQDEMAREEWEKEKEEQLWRDKRGFIYRFYRWMLKIRKRLRVR